MCMQDDYRGSCAINFLLSLGVHSNALHVGPCCKITAPTWKEAVTGLTLSMNVFSARVILCWPDFGAGAVMS